MSLPSVLLLLALLFTLAAVLLASALSWWALVENQEAQTRSRLLAESAFEEARARLREDLQWRGLVHIRPQGAVDGEFGEVSFSGGHASSNNLEGASTLVGWGGYAVPPHCVQLVAVGHSRGRTSTLNVLLRVGAFPYAVATAGPFVATGSTQIQGSLEQPEVPADLRSNSRAEEAVRLGAGSWVAGDVQASGGIVLGESSKVGGQTLAHAAPVELPEIDLWNYDPQLNGVPFQNLPLYLCNPNLKGDCRSSSNLTVAGDLHLDGATLFVHGDLDVYGGLSGRGLLVVTGNTRIRGCSALDSNLQAALLSGGDVELKGHGTEWSAFRGLVYCEGAFQAEQLRVIGCFIARGQEPTVLDDCQLVYSPDLGRLQATTPTVVWSPLQAQLLGSQLVAGLSGAQLDIGSGGPHHRQEEGFVLEFDFSQQTTEPKTVFDINEFVGSAHPLEVVAWREE